MRTTTRAAFAAASALALAVTMTACSSDETTDSATSATSAIGSAAGEATSAAGSAGEEDSKQVVEFADGWVKAQDKDMTGVFGIIKNSGSEDVHLTGVKSDTGGKQELHETVPGGSGMMMREKEGGFVIPAGGELELKPGGNHIMLMELDKPITTGQEVTLTLEFEGGETQDVTVSARSFEGGNEQYVPGGGEGAMNQHGQEGMSHDG